MAEAIGAGYSGRAQHGGAESRRKRAPQSQCSPTPAGQCGRLSVPSADARAVGALMMHFMLETVVAAHLLGVDPFGQPAVERGKGMVRRDLEAEP